MGAARVGILTMSDRAAARFSLDEGGPAICRELAAMLPSG